MHVELSIPDTVARIAWYGRIFTVERGKELGMSFLSPSIGPLTLEQHVLAEEREQLDEIIIRLTQSGYMSRIEEMLDRRFVDFGPSIVGYAGYPLHVQRDVATMGWLARRLGTHRVFATGARFKRTLNEIPNPTPEQRDAFALKESIKRDLRRLETAGAMRPLLEGSGVEVAQLKQDSDGNWTRTDIHRLV